MIEIKETDGFESYKRKISELKEDKVYLNAIKEDNFSVIFEFEKELRKEEKKINELFNILENQKKTLIKGDENEN